MRDTHTAMIAIRNYFLSSTQVPAETQLLLDRLDILPPAAQPFFPQADFVVTCTDSEDVAAQRPADTPCHSIER